MGLSGAGLVRQDADPNKQVTAIENNFMDLDLILNSFCSINFLFTLQSRAMFSGVVFYPKCFSFSD